MEHTYRFHTTAHMKDHNCDKYFILPDAIGDFRYRANNLKTAMSDFLDDIAERGYTISANAFRNREPIYTDIDKQCGYLFTCQADFRTDTGWSKQYFNLFVRIYEEILPDFY